MLPIFFHAGPVTLHTYGLMVAIGFLLALRVTQKQFNLYGLPASLIDSLVFCLMFFGLLGARILYFGVDHFVDLQDDPLQFFRIWEGGLVLYGGVLAGIIVVAVFSRLRKIPFFTLTDALAAPLLMGQALGRVGCFAAGCCYGRPTDFPLHVTFTHPDALAPRFVPMHPTQLYEAVGDLVLFFCVLIFSRKRPQEGSMTAFYLIGYGLFRFLMEYLRGDDRGINLGAFSPSQAVALAMMAMGLGVFIYGKKSKVN